MTIGRRQNVTAAEILAQLEQLKQNYEQDCANLRLSLYGNPRFLAPQLADRSTQYNAERTRILAQRGSDEPQTDTGATAQQ